MKHAEVQGDTTSQLCVNFMYFGQRTSKEAEKNSPTLGAQREDINYFRKCVCAKHTCRCTEEETIPLPGAQW
jgi:hypothetical protein